MFKRFSEYLSKEFRGLPNSAEVTDFREELLGSLMEKSEELKAAGDTDDNSVFNKCISSINGFQDTLKVMRSKPIIKKEVAKAAKTVMYFSVYMLVLVGVFLAVSFVTGNWGKSWLIIVEGCFVGLIILQMLSAAKGLASGKIILPRLALFSSVSLATLGMFLGVSFLMGIWAKSWIIMLFLPVFILLTDIIIAAVTHKKNELFASTVVFVPIAAAMVYVSLGYLRVLSWHPYWLIVLCAVIVDAVIVTFFINAKLNKK
ncbi:MAG: hypothetical protein PHC84_03905 [Clostridia bacterium]|nr:hypothetical protein [Clostridia bacterium]